MADIADDATTTATISAGGQLTSVLGVAGDVDWIATTLTSGTFLINLAGITNGGLAAADPQFSIYAADGTTVLLGDDDSGAGTAAFAIAEVTTPGTYYIAVSAGTVGTVGGYRLSLLADDVPGNSTTPASLAVGSSISGLTGAGASSFDSDAYAVTLKAGSTYKFTLTGNTEAAGATALTHPYLQLFAANGLLLEQQSNTLVFTPTTSGTYTISAGGQFTTDSGAYDLSVAAVTAPSAPDDTPLDAIDWRDYTAPSEVRVYFAGKGHTAEDIMGGESGGAFVTDGWTAAAMTAAKTAFANYEAVANVHFTYVNSIAAADFVMLTNPNTKGTAIEGAYGYWDVGGGTKSDDGLKFDGALRPVDGVGVFNSDDPAWSNSNLRQGAYGYITLIHEIGHGMGLAHPHDTGGSSEVLEGVTPNKAYDDYGDFDLNQGVFTTMSYNDGWHTAPQVDERIGTENNFAYGWQGTLMALDIAELQRKYGANTATRTGDDTYTLKDTNGVGTYYQAIWDAGGTDSITYAGTRDVHISLVAASLDYSATGGGVVSYVHGIYGGFAIAKGAQIENIQSGSGDDWLEGNSGHNRIDGGSGSDVVDYSSRHRAVLVTLNGSHSVSVSVDGKAEDTIRSVEGVNGGTKADHLIGDDHTNSFTGNGGRDTIDGGDGHHDSANYDSKTSAVKVTLNGGHWATVAVHGTAEDRIRNIENISGGKDGDTLKGDSNDNVLSGNAGQDTLIGGSGADTLSGGTGRDSLSGGSGDDQFRFDTTPTNMAIDVIADFVHGHDAIALDHTVFKGIGGPGTLSSSQFRSGVYVTHAKDSSDHIIYDNNTGRLYYDDDANARPGHESVQIAILSAHPNLTASDILVV